MAHYKVQTDKGTIEFDSPHADLNKDEVEQIINQNSGTAPKPTQPNTMQSMLGLDPNASMGTQAAQAAFTPFRGTRGIGVGLENFVAGKGLQPSLQRASEATQPGFQPKGFMEGLASVVGESGPLMPLSGPMSAGMKGAAIAGGVGTGTSALMQKSERGNVSPIETGIAGILSALPPVTTAAVKKIYPHIAAKFTKTSSEAWQKLMDDPTFLQKFEGTAEAIKNRANAVVEGFQAVKKRLSDSFENFKTFYSMRPDASEVTSELAKTSGQPRTVADVVKDFKSVKMQSAPVVEKQVTSPLMGPTGKPIVSMVKEPGLFKRERLMKLIKLKQDLNESTQGHFNDYTYKLRNMINDEIRKIPQGRHYMKLQQRWSDFKDVEEALGRDMADPQKAPIVLEKFMRGDIKGTLSGSYGKVENAIKELEKFGGVKPILAPLKDEILSGMLKGSVSEMSPKGVIGKAIMLKYPGVGLAEMALSSPDFMAKMTGPVRSAAKRAGGASVVTPSAVNALIGRRE